MNEVVKIINMNSNKVLNIKAIFLKDLCRSDKGIRIKGYFISTIDSKEKIIERVNRNVIGRKCRIVKA